MNIRVYYEDTDAGGIVYHTNYIKYCERARSEVFFEQNMLPTLGDSSGFVVRDIKASFLATAVLGDMLEVRSTIVNIKNSSIILLQEVWKEKEKCFSMEIVLVFIDKGKPCRIPQRFKEIFTKDYD
ncbi:MAG: acyl-CoA thioesterase [Sulfurovum sp.]|nr:acyl-CoA thioesterase [Sulfurovum sp.]